MKHLNKSILNTENSKELCKQFCEMYNVANKYFENLLDLYSYELYKTKNAIKIQKQFKESITNPEYMFCKRRLRREFDNLCKNMI